MNAKTDCGHSHENPRSHEFVFREKCAKFMVVGGKFEALADAIIVNLRIVSLLTLYFPCIVVSKRPPPSLYNPLGH